MTKKDLKSMPPFPFPKEFFPEGTFPPGVRQARRGTCCRRPCCRRMPRGWMDQLDWTGAAESQSSRSLCLMGTLTAGLMGACAGLLGWRSSSR